MFRRQAVSISLLGAASLLFESTMTRLLAVTQFYHFAFLVVSLALLGYGASGSWLAISPRLRRMPLDRLLMWTGLGFSFAVLLAYGVINYLPFDSYAIAWDRRQLYYFGLYYLVLSVPFLMSGLAVGASLSTLQGKSHLAYAANLSGSGIGALVALPVLEMAGVPGAVLVSGLLGLGVVLISKAGLKASKRSWPVLSILAATMTLAGLIFLGILIHLNSTNRAPLGLVLSPYKGLAHARRVPQAEWTFGRWNAISRIDVLQQAGTHHLPGLSYVYQGKIPPQAGLSLDGDALQAITLAPADEFTAASYLPESVAYDLKPGASTLILEPGGGLGILQALAGGASQVTVVLSNPLEVRAVQHTVPSPLGYADPRVRTTFDSSRTFLADARERFDLLVVPLTDSFRPVTSGAYSLAETYDLTVEAFRAALECLEPQGIFVITRWIQLPPSEGLRVAAMLVAALAQSGEPDPGASLVMFRGIQTMTFLVKPAGWDYSELQQVRAFAQDRKYDLVWLPGIQEAETNRFNRLAEPLYYQAIRSLLESRDLEDYYAASVFDIKPPSDDHPFFFHFFKWEQTPAVIASYGHTWQPFGGSGYLVTFALLGLTLILSTILILLPLAWLRVEPTTTRPVSGRLVFMLYFGLLGLGFLLVEIPLIQKSILLLGHPIHAFTVVVCVLLVCSSLGSALARRERLPRRALLVGLVVAVSALAAGFQLLVSLALGWPFWGRVGLVMTCLAPLGVMMGLPFPSGLIILEETRPEIVPWVWGVNGSVSVVASVTAAILALSWDFSIVLWVGACVYAGVVCLFLFASPFQPSA